MTCAVRCCVDAQTPDVLSADTTLLRPLAQSSTSNLLDPPSGTFTAHQAAIAQLHELVPLEDIGGDE
eukprot:2628140-Pyramimonas_sp.AAC.1